VIAGIVLAGGRSRRMGRPKALLQAGDATFLEHAIATLRAGGCDDIMVVVNDDNPEIARAIFEGCARAVTGAGPDSQQIDSLRAGLRALPDGTEAAVVLPVDHPRVAAETVRALIAAFRARGAPVVRPVYGGEHGHPVLFAAEVFDELLEEGLPEGARTVVRRHAAAAEDVAVEDPGVVIDVDTPETYEENFGDRGPEED
jgi:CTP:molybdopterin cytidylyltransferase MocA